MNYQYNQQPNQQPPQQPAPPPVQPPQQPVPPPNYAAVEAEKKRKKAAFEEFADKVAGFCRGNGLLAALSGFSDILSYIVTGVCVVMSLVLMFMGSIYSVCSVAAILAGVLAISKKTVLPLAVALSGVALVNLIGLIFTIVFSAAAGSLAWLSSQAGALATAYVFQIIFILLELAVLALPVIIAWQYFAATLPPKVYQPAPMYNGQAPVQQPYAQQPYQQPAVQAQPAPQAYQQPVQAQPAPVQQTPPPAPVQAQPAVPPQPAAQPQAPAQPQAADFKYCSTCGTKNQSDAAFCSGCGAKM